MIHALGLTLALSLAPLPVFTEDHWIIVTGSASQQETARLLADAMKRWPTSIEPAPGYPKILSSDGKTGLNPGFVIAVAGECSDPADALAVRDALRKTIPGAYIRKVARYLPGFPPHCPRRKVAPSAPGRALGVPKGYSLVEEGPAGEDVLVWKIYASKRECGQDVLVRLLGEGGRLVEERTEKAHCVQGDPNEPGSGESKIWSASLSSDEGSTTRYVMLTYEAWAADTGCNGGVALCPGMTRMFEEPLEGRCNSSGYQHEPAERHCGD